MSSGKGERLLPDTVHYLQEIEKVLDQAQGEELSIAVANAHDELKGKEYRLAVNPRCSRILEKILKCSNEQQTRSFFRKMLFHAQDLLMDRCASHVFELVINSVLIHGWETSELEELVSAVKAELLQLACNASASFVLRTLLLFESFADTLGDAFLELESQDFGDICCNTCAAPLFQQMIQSEHLSREKKNAVLDQFRHLSEELLVSVAKDKIGSRTFEVVLKFCPNGYFQNLFSAFFVPKLKDLIRHDVANFVVQALITNLRHPAQREATLREIMPLFNVLSRPNRMGVLAKLAESLGQYSAPDLQKEFFKSLHKSFKSSGSQISFFSKLTFFKGQEKLTLGMMGVLLVQHLFLFDFGIVASVVQDIVNLEPINLKQLAMDDKGSRLLESLLQAPKIPLKLKNKIIDKVTEAGWGEVGTNKYGSHFLETCFKVSNIDRRKKIALDLVPKLKELSGSHFGRMLVRNCKVDMLQTNEAAWIKRQQTSHKTKRMFAEILDEKANDEDELFRPKKIKS